LVFHVAFWLIIALLLHRLSYDVLAERAIFSPSLSLSLPVHYKSSPLSEKEIETFSRQLLEYLEQKKPFLDPALKAALEVLDTNGLTIAYLHKGELLPGRHAFKWQMSEVAAGIYFIRARAGNWEGLEKVALVK